MARRGVCGASDCKCWVGTGAAHRNVSGTPRHRRWRGSFQREAEAREMAVNLVYAVRSAVDWESESEKQNDGEMRMSRYVHSS